MSVRGNLSGLATASLPQPILWLMLELAMPMSDAVALIAARPNLRITASVMRLSETHIICFRAFRRVVVWPQGSWGQPSLGDCALDDVEHHGMLSSRLTSLLWTLSIACRWGMALIVLAGSNTAAWSRAARVGPRTPFRHAPLP